MAEFDKEPSEADIQSKILISVTAIPGALFWRNNTGKIPTKHGALIRFGCLGSPDIIGIYKGRFVGLEVKTSKGRQSPPQRHFQAACEKAGGTYAIVRSPADALAVLATIR